MRPMGSDTDERRSRHLAATSPGGDGAEGRGGHVAGSVMAGWACPWQARRAKLSKKPWAACREVAKTWSRDDDESMTRVLCLPVRERGEGLNNARTGADEGEAEGGEREGTR